MAVGGDVRRRAYVEKARAELAVLDAAGVATAGNAFASVLLAKGQLSDEERGGGRLLGGPDGAALRAALAALGYAPEDWCALATARADGRPLSARALRLALSTLDPATVVTCDDEAAAALREALADALAALPDPGSALLTPGVVVRVAGLRVLNLGGFSNALADEREKQLMWAYLKQIPPLAEPY